MISKKLVSVAAFLSGFVLSTFAGTSVSLNTGSATHTLTLTSWSYDAGADETTFVYQVTSGTQPAISHWVLGLDLSCKPVPEVVSSKPAVTPVLAGDPKIPGLKGLKFDTGFDDGESRSHILVLEGKYTAGPITVGIKAGEYAVTGQVDGPVCDRGSTPPPAPLSVTCPTADASLVGPLCNDPGQGYATVELAALPTFSFTGGVAVVTSTSYVLAGSGAYTPVNTGIALQFPVGTTTVTFTATSAATNETQSCHYTVVVDYCGPTFKDPSMAVVKSCSQVVTFGASLFKTLAPGAEITEFTSVPSSNSTFPFGTTPVSFTVKDSVGNTTTGTLDVVVEDTLAPVINISNRTAELDLGQCYATVSYAAIVTDCNATEVTYSPVSGSRFTVGTHEVKVTATDAVGNTAEKSFTVTVNPDTQAPVVTVPANIVTSTSADSCSALVSFSFSATDNCPDVVVTSSHASGSAFPKGTTTVVVTAIDKSGNTATESFSVTVVDAIAPVVVVPASITASTDAGVCSAVVPFHFSATDNCPGVTVTSTHAPGSVFPKGTTIVTVTAVDAAGNVVSRSFTVTVLDTEAPVVTVPANQVLSTDAGLCSATFAFVPQASDNCPGVTVTSDWAGGSFPKGVTTVSVTATDEAGNVTTKSFTVTVVDTEAPVVSCPADVIAYTTASSLVLDPGTATYSDNCGAVLSWTRSDGATSLSAPFNVGTTTVTWTAIDEAGNITSCEQRVVLTNRLGAGGGLTMGFWGNNNGQSVFASNPGTAAILNALNLRNANGSHFVIPMTAAGLNAPDSAKKVSEWLRASSATNMSYMLSAQMTATKLNVLFKGTVALAKFSGGIDGNAYLYAPGTKSANAWGVAKVNDILAEADAALAGAGNLVTLSGAPAHKYQEALKNACDNANNNRNFLLF